MLDDFGADAPERRIPLVSWLRVALLLLVLACLFQHSLCAQVKEVRRVLIFYELGLSSPGVELVDRSIRDALQNSTYQIELYREYLETTLFPAAAAQQEIRQWYVHKYRDIKPDLIIAAGRRRSGFSSIRMSRPLAEFPLFSAAPLRNSRTIRNLIHILPVCGKSSSRRKLCGRPCSCSPARNRWW